MRKLVVVALSSLFLAAPLALAGGPHGGFHHGRAPEAKMERHLEKLGLEPEQMERVRGILASSKEARQANREKIREAYREMRALLDQESPDEAAIMEQAGKMGELKTEEHKAMLRTLLAVRAELTPEQREKLKELKRSHRKAFWHGRKGDGPPAAD